MTMTMKSFTFHELQEPEQAWRQELERLRFDQGVIFDAVTAGECKTPFGLHCERKNTVQARKVAYQKSRGRSDHAIGVVRSSDAETAVRIKFILGQAYGMDAYVYAYGKAYPRPPTRVESESLDASIR